VQKLRNPTSHLTVAVVGKYVELPDSYLSVREALIHAGVPHGIEVDVRWVQSGGLEQRDLEQELADADGIVIPGGFGERGAEGEVAAARFARETKLPFLGLCRGMQQMVIEFARDVLGWDDATSTEFDPESRHPVISLLDEQKGIENLGGTMRLGHYPCTLREGSKARAAFGRDQVDERHRHRWEFNNSYKVELEQAGLIASGTSPDGSLVEICELRDHPFMIGSQFHPELRSRPGRPHPLFAAFMSAVVAHSGSQTDVATEPARQQ
jgi:CTP synthase